MTYFLSFNNIALRILTYGTRSPRRPGLLAKKQIIVRKARFDLPRWLEARVPDRREAPRWPEIRRPARISVCRKASGRLRSVSLSTSNEPPSQPATGDPVGQSASPVHRAQGRSMGSAGFRCIDLRAPEV